MSNALVRKLIDGAWRWVQEEDRGSPIRYDVTLAASLFPSGGEVIGLGLNLEVGDTVLDVYPALSADWNGGKFELGRAPLLDAADHLYGGSSGVPYNGNVYDGGPYAGESGGSPVDAAGSVIYDGSGRGGFVPVLIAHELAAKGIDSATTGSVTLSIFVLRAAAIVTLPAP